MLGASVPSPMHPSRRPPPAVVERAIAPRYVRVGKENRDQQRQQQPSHQPDEDQQEVAQPTASGPPKPVKPRAIVNPITAEISSVTASRLSPRRVPHSAVATTSSSAVPITPPRPIARTPLAALEATPGAAAALKAVPRPHPAPAPITPLPTSATSARATAASAAATSNTSHHTSSNIATPASSSHAPSTSALAERVVRHWREKTDSRVSELSLEHRAQRVLFTRVVHTWREFARQAKATWKHRISLKTSARFHFLHASFQRWRRKLYGGGGGHGEEAPERPSVRKERRMALMTKAIEFEQLVRRRRAVAKWKRHYASTVLRADHRDQATEARDRRLLADGWTSWIDRHRSLHRAASIAETVAALHTRSTLAQLYHSWRSACASSALERAQSSVARKHAYRQGLKRCMREWRRSVGRRKDLERKGDRLTVAWTKDKKRALLAEWRRVTARQHVLGVLVSRRTAARILQAKKLAWVEWKIMLRFGRQHARMQALAVRCHTRTSQHRAVATWRAQVQVWRVQRMMGAVAYTCLQHTFTAWRRALATVRAEKRVRKKADLHAEWKRMEHAIDKWKRHAREHKRMGQLKEVSTQVATRAALHRAVVTWRQTAAERSRRHQLDTLAERFRSRRILTSVLARLRERVERAQTKAQHHRTLLVHARECSFARWRAFTSARLSAAEHLRRSKRFRYLRSLAQPFRAWREMKRRAKEMEARLLVRATPMVHRVQREILRAWCARARVVRGARRQMDLAIQVDQSTLKLQACALWLSLHRARTHARLSAEKSLRHRRAHVLTRLFRAWDAYAYARRDERRRMQEGIEWIRARLEDAQRKRLFARWRTKLAQLEKMRRQSEQAELHHARGLVLKSYRRMQAAYAARQSQQHALGLLARRVDSRLLRGTLVLWSHALHLRHLALSKHLRALTFWSKRVQLAAWLGWIRYHRMKQWKKARLAQALDQRRAKLRQEGLKLWLQGGSQLAEMALAIAQRATPAAFPSLAHRRLALKYALLWRHVVRQRRQADARMGDGFQRRVVQWRIGGGASGGGAPTVASYVRAPPLPLPNRTPPRTWHVGDHGATRDQEQEPEQEERKSTSAPPPPARQRPLDSAADQAAFFSGSLDSSHLFPTLASHRPPPRRPVDLMLDFPIPLPLPSITQQASRSIAAHQPMTAAPVVPPSVAHAPVSVSAPPPSTIESPTVDPPSALHQKLASLEDHLSRLLAWRTEAKQRKKQLQHWLALQRHPDHASSSTPQVASEIAQLQRAIAIDQEHQPYYAEQVMQVQGQIAAMMNE